MKFRFSLFTFVVVVLLISMAFGIALLQKRVRDLESELGDAYATFNVIPIPLDDVRRQASSKLESVFGPETGHVYSVAYDHERTRYTVIYTTYRASGAPIRPGTMELLFDPADQQFFGRLGGEKIRIKVPSTYDPRSKPQTWDKSNVQYSQEYPDENGRSLGISNRVRMSPPGLGQTNGVR